MKSKMQIIKAVKQRLAPEISEPQTIQRFKDSFFENIFEAAVIDMEKLIHFDEEQNSTFGRFKIKDHSENHIDYSIATSFTDASMEIFIIDRLDRVIAYNSQNKKIEIIIEKEAKEILETIAGVYLDQEDAHVALLKNNRLLIYPSLDASQYDLLISFLPVIESRHATQFRYSDSRVSLITSLMLSLAHKDSGNLELSGAYYEEFIEKIKIIKGYEERVSRKLVKDR